MLPSMGKSPGLRLAASRSSLLKGFPFYRRFPRDVYISPTQEGPIGVAEALTVWFGPLLQGFETGQYPSGRRRSLQAGRLRDVQGRDSERCHNHHLLRDS